MESAIGSNQKTSAGMSSPLADFRRLASVLMTDDFWRSEPVFEAVFSLTLAFHFHSGSTRPQLWQFQKPFA
jgi:hypothetical protein